MRKTSIIILMTIYAGIVYGQTRYYNSISYPTINPIGAQAFSTHRDMLPPSPQIASLGTFGQFPIGEYTGTTAITIPIYTLEFKDLSVPISISYKTTGAKPEDVAGNVGLDWTLQAGGMVTRVVRGDLDLGYLPHLKYVQSGESSPLDPPPLEFLLSDFRYDGDLWYNNKVLQNYITLASPYKLALSRNINPDLYYFNVNGYTGYFFLDVTDDLENYYVFNQPLEHKFKIHSQQGEALDLEITINIDGEDKVFDNFAIIDNKGNKYSFGGENAEESVIP